MNCPADIEIFQILLDKLFFEKIEKERGEKERVKINSWENAYVQLYVGGGGGQIKKRRAEDRNVGKGCRDDAQRRGMEQGKKAKRARLREGERDEGSEHRPAARARRWKI